MLAIEKNIISVSELNQQVKRLLQTQLGIIWVRGEVSGFSRPTSGHWYFTLKDNNAQIRCAMFKMRNQLMPYQPREGDMVIVRANVSIYEPRGDYQLIAEHIEPEGRGALLQAFELLKKKLEQEGLFNTEHKQKLPKYPRHIGIISSATGAAVHDICSVFRRRWPLCQLSIFPCLVQGNGAAHDICGAIQLANQHSDSFQYPIEALIVGRGGGSIEDLQAFNEESVARAIFASKLPIVSAVGHEVDFSISDFIADLRAATPSAAAEILSPHRNEIGQQLDVFDNYFENYISQYLQKYKSKVLAFKRALKHPREKLNYYREMLKRSTLQLKHATNIKLQNAKQQLQVHQQQLMRQTLGVDLLHQELHNNYHSLCQATNMHIKNKHKNLNMQASLLNAISPLATLERGYAIAQDSNGNIILDAHQQKIGTMLNIKIAKGSIDARIEKLNKN